MSRTSHGLWVGALLSVLVFTGCPSQGTDGQPKVGALQIDYDAAETPQVGAELQLHLQYTGNPPQQLMGAMIKGESATTTWFAEPAGAAEFDAANSKVTFKQQGKVKIWATFPKQGKILKSNVIVFEVGATGEAAPVDTEETPVKKGGKRPSTR